MRGKRRLLPLLLAEITCRDGAFTVQAFHLNVLKD